MGDATAPTVRADARRNRERIVDAASACFAMDGVECQITAIAAKAGVGNATVFRHFPAKRDLVLAVLDRRIREAEALVEREAANPDPAAGLRAIVEHMAEAMVSDQALKQAAGEGLYADTDLVCRRDEIYERIRALVERGKADGVVRADVEMVDLIVLVQGVAWSAAPLEARTPGVWRRYLALALEGTLGPSAGTLPAAPTEADLNAAGPAGA